ncbi:MAG: YggS family pyridoxal phosphate-dependent enzyme, partial [Thiotrichales bacterium]|nr:YggS family pyridoxal phosphate-dependent enzyme [Thiotrichales bacterium]
MLRNPTNLVVLSTKSPLAVMSISESLRNLRDRIAEAESNFGREPGSVALLAVSKRKPASAVEEAFGAGQRAFGENHLQEAVPKIEQLAALDIEWHYIGPIQSNKTRPIATHFDWVHGIDRLKVATRLSEQRPGELGTLNVCVQVNV